MRPDYTMDEMADLAMAQNPQHADLLAEGFALSPESFVQFLTNGSVWIELTYQKGPQKHRVTRRGFPDAG